MADDTAISKDSTAVLTASTLFPVAAPTSPKTNRRVTLADIAAALSTGGASPVTGIPPLVIPNSSTYTPTMGDRSAGIVNNANTFLSPHRYLRISDLVVVLGAGGVQCSNIQTSFSITLPTTGNFASAGDASGFSNIFLNSVHLPFSYYANPAQPTKVFVAFDATSYGGAITHPFSTFFVYRSA